MAGPLSPSGENQVYATINPGEHHDFPRDVKLPFVIRKSLGAGATAHVNEVSHIRTGQLFAVKIFRGVNGRTLDGIKKQIQQEVSIMKKVASHHHMVRVYATYVQHRECGIILEPVAEGGDLGTLLDDINDGAISLDDALSTILYNSFGCLASALAFIHKHTIRHKDIKPANILIHNGLMMYTDFGISLDASQLTGTTTTGTPNAFTRRYSAPEVIAWEPRNSKSDVFSLGCVYLEILGPLITSGVFKEVHAQGTYAESLTHILDVLNRAEGLVLAGVIADPYPTRTIMFIILCFQMLEEDPQFRLAAESVERSLLMSTGGRQCHLPGLFCVRCFAHATGTEEETQLLQVADGSSVVETGASLHAPTDLFSPSYRNEPMASEDDVHGSSERAKALLSVEDVTANVTCINRVSSAKLARDSEPTFRNTERSVPFVDFVWYTLTKTSPDRRSRPSWAYKPLLIRQPVDSSNVYAYSLALGMDDELRALRVFRDLLSDKQRRRIEDLVQTCLDAEKRPNFQWSLACIQIGQRDLGNGNHETAALNVLLKGQTKYV